MKQKICLSRRINRNASENSSAEADLDKYMRGKATESAGIFGKNYLFIRLEGRSVNKKGIAVKLLKQIGFIWILGGIYLVIVLTTGYGIPCLFYKLTGWKCPGCGMTRAVVELWKGNFKEALKYNFLSLTIVPFICLYLLYRLVHEELHNGEGFHTWEYAVLIGLLIVIIGYAYVRNTI